MQGSRRRCQFRYCPPACLFHVSHDRRGHPGLLPLCNPLFNRRAKTPQVADASPLPLVIYNFPGVTQGIDLSSDQLLQLAKHPNIVGVKLTCGNIGKMSRIVPEVNGEEFAVFAGLVDALVPSLVAGASGAIGGLCNLVPKTVVRAYRLAMTRSDPKELNKIQKMLADADAIVTKTGVIAGTKYALEYFYGYGGEGRRPLQPPSAAFQKLCEIGFKSIVDYENSL